MQALNIFILYYGLFFILTETIVTDITIKRDVILLK